MLTGKRVARWGLMDVADLRDVFKRALLPNQANPFVPISPCLSSSRWVIVILNSFVIWPTKGPYSTEI